MLLDGLKLILENGWTIDNEELTELFDMCRLKDKVFYSIEYAQFLEYIMVLTTQLGLDQQKIQNYFNVKF